MTTTLDIHPASKEELVAAHRNVFDLWSKGLTPEEHVRSRLDSPSHGRATWYVGTLNGQVVTSLGCYPLCFRVADEQLPGIAIGSVYTLSDFRGRGLAPQLIAWVEDDQRKRQAALSVLYSDIEPQYYARRGYTLCPSWEGWSPPADIAASGTDGGRLTPISAVGELSCLMDLYSAYHGAAPLSIARDAAYWASILNKSPADDFYALEEGPRRLGYVRIAVKSGAWRITDYALADQSDALAERLYQALAASAREAGATRLGGWLPDNAAARKFFQLVPRAREITMLKSLSDRVTLGQDRIAAASRFCEIDHV